MKTHGKKTVYFRGIRFCRDENRNYFLHTGNRGEGNLYLHQEVYKAFKGAIPKGSHIHHKDGDKDNNDPDNLVLMDGHEHLKLHGREMSEERREWCRNNMNTVARPKAIEWHKSEEGREWHRKHAKEMGDKFRVMVEHVCENKSCGKKFVGPVHSRFCCNACKSKWRRDNGLDDIEKTCPVCGHKFMTSKFRDAETCGRSCANRYRAMKRKVIVKTP